MRIPVVLFVLPFVACASSSDQATSATAAAASVGASAAARATADAPSIGELGGHHFPIATRAPAAQARFDEGLAWCNGFHHAEALRCFAAAAAADPDCAMAYWGLAFAAGPHINNMEMDPESAQQANTNAQRAKVLAAGAPPVERALIDAIVARYAWPAPAVGHLVHMPAHILMRLGRYEEAAEANRRGIAADLRIVARTGRAGFYEVYRAHNYHFLAWAAMFTGNAAEAIAAGKNLLRELPMEVVQQIPQFLEGFLGAPYHTLVRFGRWQEMLARPAPADWQKSAVAMWHYGRGIAHAALGQLDDAMRERDAFRAAVAAVPEDWTMGNNKTRTVLAVGDAVLDGEVEFRRGNHDVAFASMRKAAELDEALRYDEPWAWMMPPRHALGALLLEAGRVGEAEQVYRADLARHRDNGWALRGLAECLERSGQMVEANAARGKFEAAWRHADVRIESSCFCRK